MGRSKDTIRVFLRIRPERFKRPVGAAPPAYHIEHTFDDSSIAFHVDRRQTADIINNSVEDFRFRFDRIFEPSATQSEVFDTVARDCVLSALDGYNSTIFAYGQTGSGKTFSITGGTESYDDRGIIPRALSLVFDEVARRADSSSYVVRISYLQIYNDKGQDLLNRGKDAKTLEELPVVTVQETEEEVLLKGLEGHVTSSVSEALNLLFLGDTNRLYCETPMNKTSSRSHCVFTISFESRSHDGTAAVRRSKLHLVDLAGSERVAKTGVVGQVLTEAKYINLSLHFLEHVITSLSDAARGVGNVTHIPFRNSMMTMVLRDSLGGNCRTAMLATAYPTSELFLESISTCKFAQRVAQIEQHAKVNEVTDATVLIRQLKQQVAQLKEQLGLRGQDTSSATSLRDLSLDELSRCKELVRTFVEDPDPNAQLTGLGGDYARIVACFQILKQMIRLSSAAGGVNKGTAALLDQIGGGGGGGRATSSSNSNNNNNNGASAARTAAVEALEQQLEAMTVSLQQKENELSLLLQIVESHHRPKFNASTQTGASSSSSSSGYSSAAAAAISTSSSTSTSFMAAPPPIHPAAITSSSSAAAAEDAAQALADRQVQLLQDRGYNFNALTDRELLRDRATAFEHFRRSYRKFEQVEQTKTDLKRRYESCKQLADRVNQLVETIKRLKARVQHLRAERVLTNSTSEPEPEETEALRQLDGAKQSYGALVKQLGTEKEQVEHIQLMMSRTQEQMSKDFDEWFGLRQQQLVLATNNNNNTGRQPSPPPPASTSFASLSNPSNNTAMQPATPPTPPPQQQQQVVTLPALYHPPSRNGGGGGGAASTMTGGGGGRLGGGGSSNLNQHSYDERGGVGGGAPSSADGMGGGGGGGGLLSGSVMSRLNAAASQRVHVNSAPSTSSSFSATTTAGGGGAHHQHYSSQQQQATSTTTTLSNNFFPPPMSTTSPLTTGSSSSSSQSQQQRPNPYAPNYPSTGNAQADAELAEMYKARELMRAKLLTGGR